MIDAKRIVPGLDRFHSDHFQDTPNIKTSFSLCRSELKPPTRSSQDIKGLSGHGKAILQLYKVLTKLRMLNGWFLKIEILENLPVMKASDRLWSTISLWITILAEALTTLERKL